MGAPDPRRRRRALLIAGAAAAAIALAVLLVVLLSSPSSRRPPPSLATTAPPPPTTSTAPPKPPPPAPAKPAPAGVELGASVNWLFNYSAFGPAQVDARLASLARTGVTVARTDAFWAAAEPSAPNGAVHSYDWTFADRVAGALAAHGLHWLPIVDYSAPWAESVSGRDHSAPSSAAAYAEYAASLAARYGTGGSFWRAHPQLTPTPAETFEIWNEPDNPVFWAHPDAARYADLYAAARDAIDAVDPSARVIVGGLTHPEKFLPAMLAARPDLRGHIDGVAIHPYAPSPLGVLGRVRTARDVLRSAGLSTVPLYATEFGWTTRPPNPHDYAPESLRPGFITTALAVLGHVDCGVAAVVYYTWVTPERDPHDREQWFGIDPPDGGASPDAAAFAVGVRRAGSPAAPIKLCG